MVKRAWASALVFALVGTTLFSSSAGASAPQGSEVVVELRQLPPEAQKTHRLIVAGGPFPYAKDGSVFANRERLLPVKPRGFYREYTVPTPAAADRGAKRIVCGGRQPEIPQTCFYSGDHYASFGRIVP
jgi:ribonuclease T1